MVRVIGGLGIASRFIWCLVAIGVLLQANHYFDYLSFWADEAWLALDLNQRSLSEIFFNINLFPYYSVPPVGFLLIIKSLVLLFGKNEYVFRFFPFVCGITAIFLYKKFLKNYFSPTVTIIALMFFVFCNPWIFFTAQLKQYASDVLVTIIMYLLSFYYLLKPIKSSHILLLSLAGLLCLACSHSSVFIVGGIALAQSVLLLKNKKLFKSHMFIYFSWFLFFLVLYFFYFRSNFTNVHIISYQKESFLSLTNLPQLRVKLFGIFNNPVGVALSGLIFPVFLIGIYQSFKKNNKVALQLIFPLILTALASVLHKYPFHGRFLLFLIPILFIFIAEGFDFLLEIKYGGRLFR